MTFRETTPGAWTARAVLQAALAAVAVGVFFTWLDNYAYLFWGGPAPIKLVWRLVGRRRYERGRQ